MSVTELDSAISALLGKVTPAAAVKTLHFAARIVSHRTGSRTPWLPDVTGEPNAEERGNAERIVALAEQAFSLAISGWDESMAAEVIALLLQRALQISTAKGGRSDRLRAQLFLSECRNSSFDRYFVTFPMPGWKDFSVLQEETGPFTEDDEKLLRIRLSGASWEQCAQELGVTAVDARVLYSRILRRLLTAAVGE